MSASGESDGPRPERPPGQYEFDKDQNALMGDLGSKMQFVGMFSIVIGALVLMGGVLAANAESFNPGGFIAGLLYIALGAWTRSAGSLAASRTTSTMSSPRFSASPICCSRTSPTNACAPASIRSTRPPPACAP